MKLAKTPFLNVAKTALVLIASVRLASAQIVYQADFDGTNTGTGGLTNIATFGGTASLVSGGGVTTTIASSPLLLPGALGFLHLNDTSAGGGSEGMNVLPSSAAHSLDSWYSTDPSYVYINGAIDFFFRDSVSSANWGVSGTEFRPIDVSGGNGGLRFIINSAASNRLQAELVAKNSAGTTVMDLRIAPAYPGYAVAANTLYHVGVVVSTDTTSHYVTMKLFQVPGNTPIYANSTQYLSASGTNTASLSSTGTNAIGHAFNAASGLVFGQINNSSSVAKTLDFGSLRIYNTPPVAMGSVTYLPLLATLTPSASPVLPANFDTFNPPFTTNAPAANTPAMAEWTRTANPGDGLVLAGQNFSTNAMSSPAFGKDTSFITFGETTNTVMAPVAPAGIRRLSTDGNSTAALELAPSNTSTNFPALPPDSMYIVWPQNGNGAGTPIMVNQAEAWWLGPNLAASATASFTSGSYASVYGRNLELGTAIAPEVWIQTAGATSGGVAASVNLATSNPYKLDFTIPALSNGSYQVWVHNGHGGAYGWSLCPQPLVLSTPISWTGGPTVLVPAATGTASVDTSHVQTALTTAGGEANTTDGATVSFPAGSYMINTGLNIPANVQLVGSGSGTATQLVASVSNINMINVSGTNASMSNLELTVASTCTNTYMLHGKCLNVTGQGSYFDNVTLCSTNNSSEQLVYMGPCQNTFFEKCTFIGGQVIPSNGTQLMFDGCTFKTMFDTLTINLGGTQNGFSITNCQVGNNGTWTSEINPLPTNTVLTSTTSNTVTLSSAAGVAIGDTVRSASGSLWYDTVSSVSGNVITLNNPFTGAPEYPSSAQNPGDVTSIFNGKNVGQGIFVKGLNNTGSRNNLYYGGNTTTDFADPCSIDNWGENISFEGNCGVFYGTPTSVVGNTMTFTMSGSDSFTNAGLSLDAVITNGTGLGQARSISYTLSGSNTLTVTTAQPWNVNPDTSTSMVAIGEYANNVVIYNNTFGGEYYFANHDSNRHGAVLAAGVTQMVIDSNTIADLDAGMDVNGQGQRDESTEMDPLPPANHMQPEYFDLVQNNTINDCYTGISLGGGGEAGNSTYPAIAEVYNLGQIYRDNTITSPIVSGVLDFCSAQPSGFVPANEMLLVDDNTFTSCPSGFFFAQNGTFNNISLQGNTILTGNTLTFGGSDPGSRDSYGDPYGYGVDWTAGITVSPDTALSDNTYASFPSGNYSSSGLGAILEAPTRSFPETASKTLTTSVSDAMLLWNDGVSAMNWTVTTTCDSPAGGTWLSATNTSGTTLTETNTSLVNFTCNSASLTSTGTYVGHITASAPSGSGTITRTAQVTFVVGP